MKSKSTLLSCALIAVSSLFIGCKGGPGLFVPRQEVTPVVTMTSGTTNVATVGTNVTVTITPAASQTNYVTNIVYAVNPTVDRTLSTAKQVTEFIPAPFSGIASGVLGLASIVLAFIARQKSEKAKLLPVLIQGVELANSPQVKDSINKVAIGLGLQKQLDREVQAIT